jgi:two-component system chemotaxis response regulator CheB
MPARCPQNLRLTALPSSEGRSISRRLIGELGGCTVVQDPDDAAFIEMPINALKLTQPDHVVALDDMPALLTRLAHQQAGDPKPISNRLSMELKIARGSNVGFGNMDRIGRRSVFTCPDCGGAMWEIDEGNVSRFRCHVGHAYTNELMGLALDENLYRALATALRTLEDRAELATKLQREAEDRRQQHAAATWAAKSNEFRREVAVIEGALHRMDEIAAMRNGRGRPLPE